MFNMGDGIKDHLSNQFKYNPMYIYAQPPATGVAPLILTSYCGPYSSKANPRCPAQGIWLVYTVYIYITYYIYRVN